MFNKCATPGSPIKWSLGTSSKTAWVLTPVVCLPWGWSYAFLKQSDLQLQGLCTWFGVSQTQEISSWVEISASSAENRVFRKTAEAVSRSPARPYATRVPSTPFANTNGKAARHKLASALVPHRQRLKVLTFLS